MLAMAVCSATIARRVEVEPRRGWREPVNLFVAVLLDGGNCTSAVFADAEERRSRNEPGPVACRKPMGERMKKPPLCKVPRLLAIPGKTGEWRRRELNPEAERSKSSAANSFEKSRALVSAAWQCPSDADWQQLASADTELALIVAAWTTLPEFIRKAVMAFVVSSLPRAADAVNGLSSKGSANEIVVAQGERRLHKQEG
jgi:hypothetical protein